MNPLIAALVFVVGVVLVAAVAIWILHYLVPDHPNIIDRGIWVVVVLLALIRLARVLNVRGLW